MYDWRKDRQRRLAQIAWRPTLMECTKYSQLGAYCWWLGLPKLNEDTFAALNQRVVETRTIETILDGCIRRYNNLKLPQESWWDMCIKLTMGYDALATYSDVKTWLMKARTELTHGIIKKDEARYRVIADLFTRYKAQLIKEHPPFAPLIESEPTFL